MGAAVDPEDIPEVDEGTDFDALAKIERIPPQRYQTEMTRIKRAKQAERARLFDVNPTAPTPPKRSGLTASQFRDLVEEQRQATRQRVLGMDLDDLLVEAYDQFQKHKWRYDAFERTMREVQDFDRKNQRPPSLHTAHLNSMREEEKWGTEILLRVVFPLLQERGKQKALTGPKQAATPALLDQLQGNGPRPADDEQPEDGMDDSLMRAARGSVAFMEEEEVEAAWEEPQRGRVPGVPR